MEQVEVYDDDEETWHSGSVAECSESSVLIAFPNNWRENTSYPIAKVRLSAPFDKSFVAVVKQEVEVSAKTKDQTENSWWKAVVTRTNADGSFIYVRYEDGVEEILESSRVRKISTQPAFNPGKYVSAKVAIPAALQAKCRDPSVHEEFKQKHGLSSVRASDDGTLLILQGNKKAIDNAVFMSAPHFKRVAHRQELDDLRKFSDDKLKNADGNKVISIKFNIPQDLVSVAVGRGGENYKRARAIDGITQVFVDQDGTVRLSGTSDESLLAAREILEVDVGVMEINVKTLVC